MNDINIDTFKFLKHDMQLGKCGFSETRNGGAEPLQAKEYTLYMLWIIAASPYLVLNHISSPT